jgi:hypothetical protein
MKSIEKQLATQKIINLALALGLTALTAYTAISPMGTRHFEHLTVKSIKVLEDNGLPRIVIANSEFSPQGIYKGKEFVDVGSRPGMIFYNDEGTENGGLIFMGKEENGKVSHGVHMSFDRYNQDQTMTLQHIEDGDYMVTGMKIIDRSTFPMIEHMALEKASKEGDLDAKAKLEELEKQGLLSANNRAFYGTLNGDAMLKLHDKQGQTRIRMVVDKEGSAKLEFLDAQGKMVLRLPDDKKL